VAAATSPHRTALRGRKPYRGGYVVGVFRQKDSSGAALIDSAPVERSATEFGNILSQPGRRIGYARRHDFVLRNILIDSRRSF
jgi:hypothetical protein